jgi:hypothetical protein
MENIHILKTNKKSRLYLDYYNNLFIVTTKDFITKINKFQNIFITDDSKIKVGDWVLFKNNWIKKCNNEEEAEIYNNDDRIFKIILTTDPDLIVDGIQAIDDEFLEWFVKNPSCEMVDVEESNLLNTSRTYLGVDKYKIIIPKEELERGITITHVGKGESNPFELPKALPDDVFYKSLEPKQETLEEVAERFYGEEEIVNDYDISGYLQSAFLTGAKWQQEQDKNKYSEEEVIVMINEFDKFLLDNRGMQGLIREEKIKQFFKQFKKK